MTALSLLADENVDRQIVALLRRDGHEVLYVAELDPGINDDEVLRYAKERHALLLTADKDFGELVYRQRLLTEGVVLFRLVGLPSEKKAELIAAAIRKHVDELSRAFTVISPGEEGVYILHAFQKKTQKTAKKDLDIAKARFRDVIQHRTSQ